VNTTIAPTTAQDTWFDTGPWGIKTELWHNFQAFDEIHPDIWESFRTLTLRLISKGKSHYSADGILHVIRFEVETSTTGQSLKINNNWSACYSRKWAIYYPEFADFFERRKSQADIFKNKPKE